MILINNNWVTIRDLSDVSKIIREYYNYNLADELDKLISEYDEDYYNLEDELDEAQNKIEDLEYEINDLNEIISDLEDRIAELENE